MSTATKTARNIIARGTANAAFTQLTGCSVTRSGTTATLTKTSHGLSNSDKVLIQGFELEEFNGVFTISNVATNTFDYIIKQDPGANPSGTPGTVDKVTLGTAVDLSTAYGLQVQIGLQNKNTGPGVAPQVWKGVANANNEYDYIWSQIGVGDTTANSLTSIVDFVDGAVMFVNYTVCRNTSQSVDCYAIASELTSG
jgi:hypothetical protein